MTLRTPPGSIRTGDGGNDPPPQTEEELAQGPANPTPHEESLRAPHYTDEEIAGATRSKRSGLQDSSIPKADAGNQSLESEGLSLSQLKNSRQYTQLFANIKQ